MNLPKGWWAGLVVLGLTACEAAESEPETVSRSYEQMTRINSDSVQAIVAGEAEAVAGQDTAGAGAARPFRLIPLNDSGVSAEAIVAPLNDQTQVVVQIERVPAETPLDASVRRGSCAQPGAALEPVEATQYVGSGPRVARLLLPLAPAEVLNGGYSVHLTAPGAAAPAACAEIAAPAAM